MDQLGGKEIGDKIEKIYSDGGGESNIDLHLSIVETITKIFTKTDVDMTSSGGQEEKRLDQNK